MDERRFGREGTGVDVGEGEIAVVRCGGGDDELGKDGIVDVHVAIVQGRNDGDDGGGIGHGGVVNDVLRWVGDVWGTGKRDERRVSGDDDVDEK